MTEHDKRMKYIGGFALPPKGSVARDNLKKLMDSLPQDPDIDKEIRKKFKKMMAIIDAQLDNGAALPIDELLREFLLEYNGRNIEHGLRSMPASFNIMEAFYEYIPELSMFRLRPEKDHLFSSTEFLDYVTSGNATDNIADVLDSMEEGIIYSYNVSNDIGEITLSIHNGAEYGIGGAALVRHSSEISILLLAGMKTNLSKQTQELREKLIYGKAYPGKESIQPAKDRVREAVPLLGNKNFWQTLVLTRMDLINMTMDVRYLMKDCGDSFIIASDDISLYISEKTGEFIDSDFGKTAKQMFKDIEQYRTLFELCKTTLHLPLFYEEHADDISIENHPTRILQRIKKRGKPKTKIKYIGPEEKITHRSVSVLYISAGQYPILTLHKAPSFKMEVSGFWKKLPPDQIGIDKHGHPIHGRTWVEKQLTWVQSYADPGALLAQRYDEYPSSVLKEPTTRESGFVYIMRSAAHARDIFKIGITRRSSDIRSEELSSTTGSPDKFLVAQEWKVSDCAKAEAIIHQAIEKYRINPRREFFKAPYKEIVKAITEALATIEDENSQMGREKI